MTSRYRLKKGPAKTRTTRVLDVLSEDAFLSEATVQARTGITRHMLRREFALLARLRLVEVGCIVHTGIGRTMRIYKRVPARVAA